MRISDYIQKPLTNEELRRRGNTYVGTITRVVPQQVFNRWKFTRKEIVPQIEFSDGVSWIPNQRARKLLQSALGDDTDRWLSHRIRIFLKSVCRTEEASGRGVERLEKFVEVLDGSDDEGTPCV